MNCIGLGGVLGILYIHDGVSARDPDVRRNGKALLFTRLWDRFLFRCMEIALARFYADLIIDGWIILSGVVARESTD